MKKSNLELGLGSVSGITLHLPKLSKTKQKKQKQRTDKWRKNRLGRWTGSQLKAIMSNKQGKSSLLWDNIDRLFSFGATAVKYIYANAMERKTKRYIDSGEGTVAMRYGTVIEPIIFKEVKRLLKKKGIKGKLKEVGFKKIPGIPNAGVSSDAILIEGKKTFASVEIKACTNWETHYDRTFEITSDKSKDFWQIQGQCLAHNVDTCYYAVAQPPSNMADYVFYQGDIFDLEKQWLKECKVTIETVKESKLHTEALKKRIAISEDTLNDWLSDPSESLKTHLDNTIKMYELDPSKFEKYYVPAGNKKINLESKSKKTK